MCRLAAYLGPPLPLSSLLFDPPRSLEVQAYDPREQLHGKLNVDGTGVAWWNEDGDEPLRYVNDRPPWSDPNLRGLAPRLRAKAQLASVRSATVGHPYGPGNVAPYAYGRFAGAHNGFLGRYREATARPLLAQLPDSHYAALNAVSDSLALFLHAVARLQERPAAGLAEAVRRTVDRAAEIAAEHETIALLNLVVTDGERIVATRHAHATESNSLYLLEGSVHSRWPNGKLIASEPLDDDPGWEPVPGGSLVEISSSGLRITTLGHG